MNVLAEQLYYKVEREISGTKMSTIVHERIMFLYEEKIVTQHHEFPIQDVYDISYRRMSGTDGLIYLHTKLGVYPFHVRSDPKLFMERCRRTIKGH